MNAQPLPLQGIKVLDLSMLLPGPLCSLYLADLGAEVIKLEHPRFQDGSRTLIQNAAGLPFLYLLLNANKKSITLNVKKAAARELLFRLLADTDILMEGFRPDAMAIMGLGYEELHERFPRLIYCGLYGYGRGAPNGPHAGHDANFLALAGVLGLTGAGSGAEAEAEPGAGSEAGAGVGAETGTGTVAGVGVGPLTKSGPLTGAAAPALPGFQLADVGGGSLVALSAILAALLQREKTGLGQRIDVSMMAASLQFACVSLASHWASGQSPRQGQALLTGGRPQYAIYPLRDGRHVVLAALEEPFFRAFCRQAGLDGELGQLELVPENDATIKAILTDFFLARTQQDLEALFNNKDACLTLIRDLDEVMADPYLQERGLLFHLQHPRFGDIPQLGLPWQASAAPPATRLPPPELGQHNAEIYQRLGYSLEDIEHFHKANII